MGCDIHLFAEKRDTSGRWISIDKWTKNPDYNDGNEPGEPEFEITRENRFYTDGRNYNLFTALAGARSFHFNGEPAMVAEPKGVPDDASPEVTREREHWGSDGHTDSWLTLRELKAFDWSTYGNTCDDFRAEVIPKMEAQDVGEDDARIVFWFDN